MMLKPGYQFTPGYRLQKYLGRGQFGQVWQASGPGGVTLAVKFVDLTDGRGKREFAAIDRIKSVRHANLMPIIAIWQLDHEGNVMDDLPEPLEQTLDVFDIDSRGQSGFVSEPQNEPAMLIVGMSLGSISLEKFLPKRGEVNPDFQKMAPKDLLRCIEGVARGLDFLNAPNHDFGAGPVSLQHCDIKPANIVLIGDSAVICDFGLARILQRTQASMNEPAGTPAYMSPEAIDGTPSQTSDQYSLAITYYHLRTGSLPLADGTIGQVLQAHRVGSLRFDAVPEAEQKILRRATHLDWRERYESNTAMVDALRMVLNPSLSPLIPTPAVRAGDANMETLQSEELTDAVVVVTDGGSVRTKVRSNAEPLEQNVEWEKVNKTGDFGNPSGHETNHRRTNAASRERSDFDKSAKKALPIKTIAAMSVGAVVFVAGLVWRSSNPSDSDSIFESQVQPSVTPEDSLQNASFTDIVAMLDTQPDQAQLAVEKLVETDPMFRRPLAMIQKGHRDAIEQLIPIGQSSAFVTTGYDKQPKLWRYDQKPNASPESMELQMQTLAELPENALFRHAVAVDAQSQTLWVGAGSQLHRLSLKVGVSEPMKTWELDAPVLCISIHPRQSNRIAVALEDQRLVIVDAASLNQSLKPSIGSRLVDVVQQMCFLGSGSTLVLLFESGEVVGIDWDKISQSPIDETSVNTIATGVADALTMLSVQSDRFWVGHDSGAVTAYQWTDPTVPPMRTFSGQPLDSTAIETMVWTERQPSGSRVVTGSLGGNVVIWPSPDSKETAKTIQVADDPVRALAASSSGRWIVAGVNQAVIVVDGDSSQSRMATLPIDETSAESLWIDEVANRLHIGCGNGELISLDWGHCRVLTLAPAPPQSPSPSPPTQPSPSTQTQDRVTQRL